MTAFYNKHKNTIMMLTAIVIAVTTAFLTINTYGIRFQTNDDATLSNIAAGAYGSDTLHMVYVNVIFSALLRPLYAVCQTNWYVIVQLVFVVASIAVIGYILMKKLGYLPGTVMVLAIMVGFAEHIFYTFQYTECSFIILTAGLLILVDNLGEINIKAAFGIALAAIGAMIRWTSFYAVGGMSACLLLYKFFCLDKSGKKKAVVVMVCLFAATFGAKAADVLAYKADPAWDEFTKYNAARTAYSDFKILQLGEENPFADRGITDIDYIMLNNWDFYDSERFTTQLLTDISAGGQDISFVQLIKDTIEQIKDMGTGKSYNYVFLAICFLSVLALRPRASSLSLIGLFGTFGLLMLYLIYEMRFPSWVEMGLIWTVSAFALYCIGEINPKLIFRCTFALLTLCFVAYISWPGYKKLYAEYPNYVEWAALEQPYFEAMSADKDNIYLLSTQSINVAAGLDVMHPRTDSFYSNIVAYGGWLSRAPHRDKALADYGLSRPLVDAVDKPNVFLDYHNIRYVEMYVEQELGREVYVVETGTNAFAPYQLVTQLSE